MDFIIDAIVEWLKGLLVDGIMGNLDGLFNNVNEQVGEIAVQVGTTPGGLERRGLFHDTAAIRNRCPADCRDYPYLCRHL